ncbi:MAG TPA: alpha-glucan family phosphorylase [Terriglobia bacterium]|nr:alpha-glucan family phosphorylase [Terriglobia bacterium]
MQKKHFPDLPERISMLGDLAYNLEWSWDNRSRLIFKRLDPELWRATHHNPVKLLNEISVTRMRHAAEDPDFLRDYEATIKRMFRNGQAPRWFKRQFPELTGKSVAYFSAEFGIHTSLPIYSGGLGILAGDHCKESADLGIPLIGTGFAYPQGYFHQRIQADGWQEDIYEQLKRADAPIESASPDQRDRMVVELQMGTLHVFVEVWQVSLAGLRLYLMDTEVDENSPADRQLTARLYGGDKDHRVRQEIVLGIGGVRVLRALGLQPSVFHANEGHTAFMILERIRERVLSGQKFKEAAEEIQSTTVFTTHTPVAAGHDAFPFEMMDRHFNGYWDELGLTRKEFMDLGAYEGSFNMTVLALRMARWRNGVSELHGRVTRRMWRNIWPNQEDSIPISHVTNGVHAPTWIASELAQLFDRHLGQEWVDRHDDVSFWNRVVDIPDEEFWNVHLNLKRKLLAFARERARRRWSVDRVDPRQVIAMGTLLEPDALTIGFARRFTGYKRASLIFHDLERIRKILLNLWKPVQIVFAGKAHPADDHGKRLIHEIYSIAADNGFGGHVAFVENYDIHTAHFFTQGADVWLNNPRVPLEACGTSGQKAGMNGVLNVSILDGWWYEGHNGDNGWAIGDVPDTLDVRQDDAADAESLYRLLEEQIVPLYYDRGQDGIPHGWVRMAKESLRSIVPRFSARRMLKEYSTRMYVPAITGVFDLR